MSFKGVRMGSKYFEKLVNSCLVDWSVLYLGFITTRFNCISSVKNS